METGTKNLDSRNVRESLRELESFRKLNAIRLLASLLFAIPFKSPYIGLYKKDPPPPLPSPNINKYLNMNKSTLYNCTVLAKLYVGLLDDLHMYCL